MTIKKQNFVRGVILRPDDVALEGISGELKVALTSQKLQVYLDSAARELLTADQAQTITNKTIDADLNTISNIDNADIKAAAGIEESKLALDYSTASLNTAIGDLNTDLSDHISDGVDAHDASAISNVPAGSIAATDVQAAINELDTDIQNHITDSSDAHDASAISNVPSGNLAATDVQAALNELQGDIDTNASGLSNHLSDATDAHDASAISVVPTGNLAASDVQSALNELQGDADSAATHIAASTDVHGIGVGNAVVGTGTSQTLTSKTITGADIRTPVRSDVKQDTKANLVTYALTASNGQLVFATDTKELLQVLDGVLSAVGGGGIGGVDILFVQDFEAAALSDFTQTGLSLSTSSPLHGDVSALLTHDSVTNQSFKQVIAVDRKFRGEAMTMRLNVKSNATAGNVTLNVYDETNAANLVASEQLQLANDTSGALNKIGFTIPETCASLSYTITALPEAGSPVTRVDDIIAELAVTSLLETSVEVPNITAWQGYTPTFQGFGTPSAVEFEWRQVGEDVEIRGKFTSGTPTAVEARIGLPGGLTSADTSLIPSLQIAGKAGRSVSAADNYLTMIEPSVSYLTLSRQSLNVFTKSTGSAFVSAADQIGITAKVPCAGLSATTTKTIDLTQSGLVQNPDDYLLAQGNAAQAITNSATNIPFASVSSSSGSNIIFNGSTFSVTEEGVYDIRASVYFTASATRYMSFYGNGIFLRSLSMWSTAALMVGGISFKLVPGVVYSIRTDGGTGGTLVNDPSVHYLIISKQSSLKQVSVSSDQKIKIPTSELRMEGASSRGAVATAIVRFDTVAKLRGDAFTVTSTANDGTFITMRKAGKLDVSASVGVTASGNIIAITRNQTNLASTTLVSSEVVIVGNHNAGTNFVSTASGEINVAVGDIIRVLCSGTPSGLIGNVLNLFFQEQDIAVSVTNTLPQFSESDLSVKGAGNSGQAITSNVTNIPFQTVEDTTGGNWNGSQFTVPETGLYSISASLYFTTNPNGTINLYKNGTFYKRISPVLTINIHVASGIVENFVAGDVISLRFEGTGTLLNTIQYHWIAISKVGKPNVTGVDVTPFVKIPQNDVERIETNYFATTALLDTAGELRFDPAIFVTRTNRGILTVEDDSTNTRTKFTALKRCTVNVSFSSASSIAGSATLNKNGAGYQEGGFATAGNFSMVSSSVNLEVGEFISFTRASIVAGSGYTVKLVAEAASDSIITASESFSTDTASLQYAGSGVYTLSTLANAPVGTFITFTYASGGNVRTQTTVAPTQTTADMNVNGVRLFTRAYNAASTAANPTAIALQIGKGLKGFNVQVFKSTSKTTPGELDYHFISTSETKGVSLKNYDEKTGILYIDAGLQDSSTVVTSRIQYNDLTATTDGYFVINASKSPALVGVPLLQPRIALITDTKVSGSNGGSVVASSWQTRVLNTVDDSTGIVTSLASNQFVLPAGTYFIEGAAPAFDINAHKIRLRNITDGVTSLVGESAYATNGGGDMSYARLYGNLTITSAKTFELQHWSALAEATIGLGNPVGSGENEIYAQVKIQKIK
jgi:hypothetical protein